MEQWTHTLTIKLSSIQGCLYYSEVVGSGTYVWSNVFSCCVPHIHLLSPFFPFFSHFSPSTFPPSSSLPPTEERAARLEMAGGHTRRRPGLLLSRGYQTNYLECTRHILMISFSHSHSTSLTIYKCIIDYYCQFCNVLFQLCNNNSVLFLASETMRKA